MMLFERFPLQGKNSEDRELLIGQTLVLHKLISSFSRKGLVLQLSWLLQKNHIPCIQICAEKDLQDGKFFSQIVHLLNWCDLFNVILIKLHLNFLVLFHNFTSPHSVPTASVVVSPPVIPRCQLVCW